MIPSESFAGRHASCVLDQGDHSLERFMQTAHFVTVDVFTQERFRGNPLAVFPDARGLDDQAMHKIAAEFGYSEITFVLPPSDALHHACVRIFTPTAEVPFAGHPNVGTAFVLGQQDSLFGKPVGDRLLFEEKAGVVSVDLMRQAGVVTGATIRAPRALQTLDAVPVQVVAECASISIGDIDLQTHAPRFVSVGLPFVIAELNDLAALNAACPNLSAFRNALALHGHDAMDFSLFLYVRNAADPSHLRARMFAPLDNVMEDPATGSASGALAAYLAQLSGQHDGNLRFMVEQGVEMGRRSLIELNVALRDGKAIDVSIGGHCVAVMRGTIDC
jgi:trans-2,3-dihydro-3-hydroxyanthranilate isomerase